jgi:hypothetical protein
MFLCSVPASDTTLVNPLTTANEPHRGRHLHRDVALRKARTMKFGRFDSGNKKPIETYEGDRIQVDGGYVKVLCNHAEFMEPDGGNVVAAFHLSEGQSVRIVPARAKQRKTKRKP